jgi:inosine triphosphate pyrophosphatase
MKQKEIIFCTGNLNKLKEASGILKKFSVKNKKIDIPEFQGEPEFVLMEKAKFASKKLREPCFVDDTSLCFESWNGLPGPYIKDFLSKLGIDRLPLLLKGFKNKNAEMKCYIGYCEPGKKPLGFVGITKGAIVKPKGKRKFGFDPVFQPKGCRKTQAQMSFGEKMKISARTKALRKMAFYLDKKWKKRLL